MDRIGVVSKKIWNLLSKKTTRQDTHQSTNVNIGKALPIFTTHHVPHSTHRAWWGAESIFIAFARMYHTYDKTVRISFYRTVTASAFAAGASSVLNRGLGRLVSPPYYSLAD
jgi:hypothetical protein